MAVTLARRRVDDGDYIGAAQLLCGVWPFADDICIPTLDLLYELASRDDASPERLMEFLQVLFGTEPIRALGAALGANASGRVVLQKVCALSQALRQLWDDCQRKGIDLGQEFGDYWAKRSREGDRAPLDRYLWDSQIVRAYHGADRRLLARFIFTLAVSWRPVPRAVGPCPRADAGGDALE